MSATFTNAGSAEAVAVRLTSFGSGDVAIPDSEEVDLEFSLPPGDEFYDLGGFFDPDNPTHVLPPVRGIYVVGLAVRWRDSMASASLGIRYLFVTFSSTASAILEVRSVAESPAESPYFVQLADTAYVSTDPVRVIAFQDSGVDPSESEVGVRVAVEVSLALIGTAPELV